MNNITVDGSYFNNSFGLAGQPGDRTGVAPISLEAIEQVQVSVAPYDVRQGNFVGAGVNTVTRSGTNQLRRVGLPPLPQRILRRHGGEGPVVQPRHVRRPRTPASGRAVPIIKNKLFFFGSYETTARHAAALDVPWPTRAASGRPGTSHASWRRISTRSARSCSPSSTTTTGPYEDIPKETPAKPFLVKGDYNLNNINKISFRYNQLDSSPTSTCRARARSGSAARRSAATS